MKRKEIVDRFSGRSFSSGLRQNALAMRGRARDYVGDGGTQRSSTPFSPETTASKANPRGFYRVAGTTVPGEKLAEGVLPVNAEEFNPSLRQIILFRLAEALRRRF